MAADVTAIILTVACAAIAASCGVLVLRLWRGGAIGRSDGDRARRP
ncbi:MAG TPA: hypothetical protein VJT16_22970 [Streptosporangiaceae bacterium]|nr:hypothetical protein [Streptosporangiaceae bacterium]